MIAYFSSGLSSQVSNHSLTKYTAGTPKGTINPLWLNDSSGKQVTPSIKGQPLEEGRASILNKKRFRKMKGMNIFKEKQVAGVQDLKGMAGGMAPPAISSDDDDEDTGMDEPEPEVEDEEEGELEAELLNERRAGGKQVVRLVEEDDDHDDIMDSDGEDRDGDGDVQMMRP